MSSHPEIQSTLYSNELTLQKAALNSILLIQQLLHLLLACSVTIFLFQKQVKVTMAFITFLPSD